MPSTNSTANQGECWVCECPIQSVPRGFHFGAAGLNPVNFVLKIKDHPPSFLLFFVYFFVFLFFFSFSFSSRLSVNYFLSSFPPLLIPPPWCHGVLLLCLSAAVLETRRCFRHRSSTVKPSVAQTHAHATLSLGLILFLCSSSSSSSVMHLPR